MMRVGRHGVPLHGHRTGISRREYIRAVQHRLVEVEIFVLSLHQVASVATKAEERGRVDTHTTRWTEGHVNKIVVGGRF